MTDLLKELEAVVAKLTDAEGWECTGDQMRCMDGNGCECAMQGRDRPDTDGTAVNFIRTHHAEIAEVVRDSRRYRWLRKSNAALFDVGQEPEFNFCMVNDQPEDEDHWVGSDLNAAIDAAIDAHNSAREVGE